MTEPASVERAAAGCELVFNAMGLPEQWFADADIFDRVNARGTETVVRAAAAAGARRVVHTSTIDVFHAEPRHARSTSPTVADYPKGTAYERSKQHAERLALAAAAETGIELVIVNPAAVYGPGPPGSASRRAGAAAPGRGGPARRGAAAAAGRAPAGLLDRTGHRAAAGGRARGVPGERYILCDGHMSFRELAETAVRLAGRGRGAAR